jgi:hypothetical protein
LLFLLPQCVPPEYLNEKIFAQAVSADEVIGCLQRQLAIDDDQSDKGRHLDRKVEHGRLSLFIKDILEPILREMSPEKLAQFVEFCTGYHYIPIKGNEAFGIVVEMNHDEGMHDDSLPVSHTCGKILKLPWNLYGSDKVKFALKLDMAMDGSRGIMSMP